ncbi:MAG: flagellar hook protein FlgE, partial [Caulobacteraceae bacterium]|nr:flagellar hook protein FlgE [Caulobacteraceae bacterium]
MSINSALQAGVSGLIANSSALAAISDNIANVNTVGYKRQQANFSTMVTSQTRGGTYSAGGVSAKTHQFVTQQGLSQSTTSALDLSISGSGFFVGTAKAEGILPSDIRSFTRAGSFQLDDSGYLRNDAGLYLQGWVADSTGEIATDPSDLSRLRPINVASVGGSAQATTKATINANLKSGQAISPAAGDIVKLGVLDDNATPVAHDLSLVYTPTGTANQYSLVVSEGGTPRPAVVMTYSATTGLLTSPAAPTVGITLASGDDVTFASIGAGNDDEASILKYDAVTNNMAMYDATATPVVGVKPDFELQLPVSDSKGGKRTLAVSFLKSDTPNQWYAEIRAVPASDLDGPANGLIKSGLVAFTPEGRFDTVAMAAMGPGVALLDPASPVINIGGSSATAPTAPAVQWAEGLGIGAQDITLELGGAAGGLTQYDSPSVVQAVTTNGTAFGNLSNIAIDEDGFVTSIFDNGVTRRIAQVAIATFPNPDGLIATDGNAYRLSNASGGFSLKAPGTGGAGSIAPSTLESSTVDLST